MTRLRTRATVRSAARALRLGGASAMALAGASVLALAAAGCGSTQHFADNPRPPQPADLSAYVDNNHVAVSPDRVGGGPVRIKVTNEATASETLNLVQAGRTVASSNTIGANSTATIDTTLKTGSYELTAGGRIVVAKLLVGKQRSNADNALLQP